MNENILMTAICPHPPIMIPEVGQAETVKVEKTSRAVHSIARQVVELNPDTVVIVTPHSQFNPHFFNIYTDEVLEGSFANFGAPGARFSFTNDTGFIEILNSKAEEFFTGLNKIPKGTSLDHGSGVPLYFLAKAGYKGKIVVINYTALGPNEHVFFGEMLGKVSAMLGRKIVFIASGDLSHKLRPSAPAGYNPDAHYFDEMLIEYINKGDYESIIGISPVLRRKAGECGFNSIMVALGTVNKLPQNNQVLSYEAPFGVGYMVATL